MQIIFRDQQSDGEENIILLPGGAKSLVVEGNLGGGTLSFFTTYFGLTQIPINGANGTPLLMSQTGVYDFFYLAGGMTVIAKMTGSTNASFSVGVG